MKKVKKIDSQGSIWDLSFFSSQSNELLIMLAKWLKASGKLHTVFTPNPEQLVLAHQNPSFLQKLRQADVLLPDGWGVVWAWRLLGDRSSTTPQTRISGREMVAQLLDIAERQSFPVMVIGGRGYAQQRYQRWSVTAVNQEQAEIDQYGAAAPLFWISGYNDVSDQSQTETADIFTALERVRPKIVFVAFGAPYQEEWILQHRQRLQKLGVSVVMSVGGSFDTLLGLVPPPPRALAQLGLEWLYRLFLQPWRWRRQLRLLTFLRLVAARLVWNQNQSSS